MAGRGNGRLRRGIGGAEGTLHRGAGHVAHVPAGAADDTGDARLAAAGKGGEGDAIGVHELIVDHFPPKPDAPEPFRILARLPIRHVWTTNYDTLAEIAWAYERKSLDVKLRNGDLGIDKPWAHSILYKMHGSVDHPAEVVGRPRGAGRFWVDADDVLFLKSVYDINHGR